MGAGQKSDIRVSIEKKFGQWGRFTNSHAWWVILGFALLITAFARNLPSLEIDTSNESILHETNPIRMAYTEFRHQFGRDERVVIIVDTDESIYRVDFLNQLQSLHEDLEDNALRIEKVDSLINARRTYGDGDRLVVEDLLEEIPVSKVGLQRLEEIVKSNPMYRGQFIGDSDSTTMMFIETDAYAYEPEAEDSLAGFDDEFEEQAPSTAMEERKFLSGEENAAIVKSIDEVIARHQADNFRVTVGGTPHFMDALLITVMTDMTKFSISAIFLISIILGVIFKRFVLVVLPLLVSSLSVMLTVSILALLNIPFSTALQIMPTFLLAVGVSNSVHIFNAFFQSRNQGKSKEDAIVDALEHSGFAIAMSAFTTAGGLLSFAAAEILPVSYFGLSSAAGIIFSFFFSVGLLPALIKVLPIREGSTENAISNISQKSLKSMGRLASSKPVAVSAVWGVILLSCLYVAGSIRLSHEPIKWLTPEEPVRISMERLNSDFGGSMTLEVVIDTGKENGIKDPDLLKRVEEIYALIDKYEGHIEVSKAISIVDVVKETHQALNGNADEYYAIPDDRNLLSQELLLFENSGSDDLEQLVDSLFTKARMTLKTTDADAVHYPEFQQTFYQDVKEIFADYPGGEVEITFTGFMSTIGETIPALQNSLVNSYVLAFLTITPIMMFMLGSVRVGLLSMLPNIAPILVAVGLLGIIDMPMDTFTLMIGSIALGLAVDDTIHFMHNYQRNFQSHGDSDLAVQQSLTTSGQAILFTSIVLVAAFLVYTLSSIAALQNFGILLAACIATAFLADALLAPALVTLFNRKKSVQVKQGFDNAASEGLSQ